MWRENKLQRRWHTVNLSVTKQWPYFVWRLQLWRGKLWRNTIQLFSSETRSTNFLLTSFQIVGYFGKSRCINTKPYYVVQAILTFPYFVLITCHYASRFAKITYNLERREYCFALFTNSPNLRSITKEKNAEFRWRFQVNFLQGFGNELTKAPFFYSLFDLNYYSAQVDQKMTARINSTVN